MRVPKTGLLGFWALQKARAGVTKLGKILSLSRLLRAASVRLVRPAMLTHHRRPVSLSYLAYDSPLESCLETSATLYQRDRNRFHLLLSEPFGEDKLDNPFGTTFSPLTMRSPGRSELGSDDFTPSRDSVVNRESSPKRLLWLELSPSRVILTAQGEGGLNYRHLWERGVYGVSRYWLRSEELGGHGQFRLQNFTRNLRLEGNPLPQYLRLEYELWAQRLLFGRYALHLEIHH